MEEVRINEDNIMEDNITFLEYFFRIADRYPSRDAIKSANDADAKITYQQLKSKCKEIAIQIRTNLPEVNPPSSVESKLVNIVAICLPAGAELFSTMLGIWWAGCAFCNINSKLPPEEISYRILNTRACLLITTREIFQKLDEVYHHAQDKMLAQKCDLGQLNFFYDEKKWPVKVLDSAILYSPTKRIPDMQLAPPWINKLAYIAHTSGSTGRPKGVAVAQSGLLNALKTHVEVMKLTEHERILQFSGIEFDALIMEMMMALGTGSCLVYSDIHIQDRYQLTALSSLIQNNAITTMIFTPSLLNRYKPENFPKLKKIIVTGEPSNKNLLDKWYVLEIYVGYGLVETTIALTLTRYKEGVVSIAGGKMRGMDYWLSSEGEIVVSGTGLALGYFKDGQIDQDLTPKRFKCENNQRVFYTGDIAKYLDDGKMEYCGRKDKQLQIAGVTVDPVGVGLQIQNTLNQFPDLQTTFVHICATDESEEHRRLIAFIHPMEKSAFSLKRINEVLYSKHRVPFATRPRFFYLLNSKKDYLNNNYKPDPNKIEAARDERLEIPCENLPTTEDEIKMCKLWQQIFKYDAIDIRSSFEELGGYSLLFMNLCELIDTTFDVDPIIASLPSPLTVQTLTQHILKIKTAKRLLEDRSMKDSAPLIVCCLPIDGDDHAFRNLSAQPIFQQKYRFAFLRPPEQANLFTSLEEYACYIIAIIKQNLNGNAVGFLGWSFGGVYAYALAAQCRIEKINVAYCGLVDSPAPGSINICDDQKHLNRIINLIKRIIIGCVSDERKVAAWQPSLISGDFSSQVDNLFSGLSNFLNNKNFPEDLGRCKRAIDTVKINLALGLKYNPRATDLTLNIYTANQPSVDTDQFYVDVSFWKKLIDHGEIRICEFGSDHFSIIKSREFIEQLAQDLNDSFILNTLLVLRKKIKKNLHCGQYRLALELSNRLLVYESDNAEDYAIRGRIYGELGDYHYARADVERALLLDRGCITAHITYAVINMAKNRKLSHCLVAIEKAISYMPKQYPDRAFALRCKAEILLAMSSQDDAMKCYREAIEMEPDNPALHASFGLQLLLKGDYQSARLHLMQACSLHPKDNYYKALLREIEYLNSRSQPAVKSLVSNSNFFGAADRAKYDEVYQAVKNGDLEALKVLLRSGCKVDDRIRGRKTILHIACIQNKINIVEYCLRIGVDVFTYDDEGNTPFHLAVQYGHLDVMDLISHADQKQLMQLVNHKTIPPGDGKSIAHIAACHPNPKVINYCIKMGSDPDCLTPFNFTPLHFAGHFKQYDVVRWLIDVHHADPNIVNFSGYDAFEWAICAGSLQSAKAMLPRYNNVLNYYLLLVCNEPDFLIFKQGFDAFHNRVTLEAEFSRDIFEAERKFNQILSLHQSNINSFLWPLACYQLMLCAEARDEIREAIRLLKILRERIASRQLVFVNIAELVEIDFFTREKLLTAHQALLVMLDEHLQRLNAMVQHDDLVENFTLLI